MVSALLPPATAPCCCSFDAHPLVLPAQTINICITKCFDYRNSSLRHVSHTDIKIFKIVLQGKALEATKQKEEKRKNPEPEEQEGMPQRQHCPPADIKIFIPAKQKSG
jgi:hypothetical protein